MNFVNLLVYDDNYNTYGEWINFHYVKRVTIEDSLLETREVPLIRLVTNTDEEILVSLDSLDDVLNFLKYQ